MWSFFVKRFNRQDFESLWLAHRPISPLPVEIEEQKLRTNAVKHPDVHARALGSNPEDRRTRTCLEATKRSKLRL